VKQERQAASIVWFRQDLRVADHAALTAAVAAGGPVVPVYIMDDESAGPWAMGSASRWWLHHSLVSLGETLRSLGAPLVLRRGRAEVVLPALMAETGAREIHAGRMHEPWARAVDTAVERVAPGSLHLHRTSTLFDLDGINTKTGGIYGVYTPFARTLRERGAPAPALPAPARLDGGTAPTDRLEDWGLLPTRPDWASGFRATWVAGEAAAADRMAAFVAKAVHGYDVGRNLPGQPGTSMLSPHLHWGELSPGQVWSAAEAAASESQKRAGLDVYLGELLWREFAAYLLFHSPHLPEQPLRPRFAHLPARDAPSELLAWQLGHTGVPIVDAGMRQLWHIGWMHNRVRMIVASFLVKHMLMPWRAGEDWFWDTLVDADLASNAAGWQWITGCGIDSQPFFRVFNPVSQGERFDPDGAYVRRWVPEVAGLPDKWLHAPWTAPDVALRAAKLRLGHDYPRPIVDLAEGRNRALAAYRDTVRENEAAE
jgi:deoxyribodipyrimidine photo-lyase